MQLSQSVKLKQKQSLVMTPQLQQAIKLLQLSNLELSQHLQEQVDENPFLEVGETDISDEKPTEIETPIETTSLSELGESAALAEDPTEHSDFENRFDQSIVDAPRPTTANAPFEGDYDAISNVSTKEGFYPGLFKQLNLAIDDPKQRLIAGHFVNALESSGWLGMTVDEVADASGSSIEEAFSVLSILQKFEPTGLFAIDLKDCLKLQLLELGAMTDAFGVLLDNLELLGRGEVKRLARLIKGTSNDVLEMLSIIRTLNPKPGEFLGIDHLEMPSPDVIVKRRSNGWAVELNRSTLPAIVINEDYADLVSEKKMDEGAKSYSTNALNNARWLKRAVEQRNSTTLKISAEIIRQQTDFLEKGLDHLKPLSLRDVAQAVGMHESTVSRVTTGLLISTPRGGMPLKSFFSVNIASRAPTGDASAAAVRNMVKRLISEETPGKPLSDEAICKKIANEGIDLARRTVAKYREMMNIPSSSHRRMQARLANFG
ncbi:RNA polymerase factor sigma-54 [Candidatus Puniceispirillum sp.]|nr:RNA polymerase factor sigma-54 [Candidatus Puniceispirillum sp.]